jgi:basic membrane protein A and related proteins
MEMKLTTLRILSILLVLGLLLAACAPAAPAEEAPAAEEPAAEVPAAEEPAAEEPAAEEPAAEEPAAEEPAAEEPAAADEPVAKVAFVYWTPIADGGWTYAHDLGRLYLEEQIPGVETAYVESVQASADTERVLRQFAREGYDIVFTTGFDYMDPTIKVAEEFPDTYFANCSGYKTAPNSDTYFVGVEEARYLSGMVAGRMTESNIIGYVAAFPIPEVVRGINGFALGVKAVNPDAKVQVVWSNSWYDPGIEREAAESLLAAGADVLAQHQDSTAAIEAAKEAGAYGIGYDADMGWVDPDTVITSAIFIWGPYYVHKVQQIIDGKWELEQYYGHISDGLTDISPYGTKVPQEVQDEVDVAREQIISGELEIFAGPIFDNEDNEMVAEGAVMTLDELLSWQWFVDNVIGKVGG